MSRERRAFRNCCAAGCVNTTFSCNLTFFSLPSDKERRNVWLKLLLREDIETKISTHYRVCEGHFDEKSIILTRSRKVLKKNAMPCRLLPKPGDALKSKPTTILTGLCAHCKAYPKEPVSLSSHTPIILEQKRKNIEKTAFSELCDNFLSKNLATIVKEQLTVQFDNPQNKYSLEYMMFCQKLFHLSPEAYGSLSDTLCLPSKTCLELMHLPITKQVNFIMQALKTKVARMTDREKDCSLVIDAMSLRANLVYVEKEDKIYGFHEVDEYQCPEPAEFGLIAVIDGIFGSYQQPVGYALLPANANEERVSKWIDKLIQQLCEIGLNVRVLIPGTTHNFLNSAKRRRLSVETPYFFVNGKKIYYMFDASHLMILMRDSLLSYDFYFNDTDTVATWEDIRQFYEKDSKKQLRIAPMLTERHINPSDAEKTQTKLAVEVFSATVAAAMSVYVDLGGIEETAEGTIRLITKMNAIVQLFNLSPPYDCSKFRIDSCDEIYSTSFIQSILDFFSDTMVIDKTNGADVPSLLTCVGAFQITLKSLLHLYKDLEIDGNTSILTKKLNKDFTEFFFDDVKKINDSSMEPTSWQMVTEFRKSYLSIFFKSPNQVGGLKDDVSNDLQDGQNLLDHSPHPVKRRKVDLPAVASDEQQEKNSSSSQQEEDLHEYYPSTENITHQIKDEIEHTLIYEFEENSNSSYTIKEEDDQDNLTLLIKQEEEAFLAMDIEVAEHELKISSSKEQEHINEFPFTQAEQDGDVTDMSVKRGAEKIEKEDPTLENGGIKSRRKEKNILKAKSTDESEEICYLSDSIKQDQTNMLIIAHAVEEKMRKDLFRADNEHVQAIEVSTLDLPEKNALVYICGYLLEKCLVIHTDCVDFKSYTHSQLTENPADTRYVRYNDYCKNGGQALLIAPPDNFVEYIEMMDKIFCGFFKAQYIKIQVILGISKNGRNVSFSMPCKCFPLDFVKKLFIKIRLYYTLEYNNRIYNQCPDHRKFVVPILNCI